MVEDQRLLPLPDHTNPFTKQLPMAGSFITAANTGAGSNLSGPFIHQGASFDRWVQTHHPSGYYVVKALERLRVVDNGMASKARDIAGIRDSEINDIHTYEKTLDGITRLRSVRLW